MTNKYFVASIDRNFSANQLIFQRKSIDQCSTDI
ncbi:hypothetical protein EZV77_17795 [Burkholderia thailandensis]|nr:hypothetical protein A8H31_28840 [Burkholderia thailandensis]AVR26014.1 hypothetical protein A8H32_13730 [Burkholderia thailandensis]AWY59343.1 hypothetical protein A8H35_13965 [Burkholderia thailandensis]AWY66482.1 hypothetical protein A8H36_14475 [Burkholderia thailandensis]MDD1481779.1 hypothetical protein [Burkholderia thailandensis]